MKLIESLSIGVSWVMILPLGTFGQKINTEKPGFMASAAQVRLLTLDPGHFHAALVQKSMYPIINPEVYVYAPGGPELKAHLELIRGYNERADSPTHWIEKVYEGPDYLQRMIAERKGNVVVLAGNNRLKTQYIERAVHAGFHVLSDKPMAIDETGFRLLVKAFSAAHAHGVLLCDIMTERYEITNRLQKELLHLPEVFGELKKGSDRDPSVIMESIHFYYKTVSGKTLTRPEWFFDPSQQGEALADVGTHLIDLVQWICFPEAPLHYKRDIQVRASSTWSTELSLSQFSVLTGKDAFPSFLKPYLKGDTLLDAHGNGEVNFRIKGVFARVTARWAYRAPEGSGDIHHAVLKGTRAQLEIRQGPEENYRPTLYIFPLAPTSAYSDALNKNIQKLSSRYPGIGLRAVAGGWRVDIPERYKVGHEAHFAQVMEQYLNYLRVHHLPEWEEQGMLAKYYTSTKALQMAVKKEARESTAASTQ